MFSPGSTLSSPVADPRVLRATPSTRFRPCSRRQTGLLSRLPAVTPACAASACKGTEHTPDTDKMFASGDRDVKRLQCQFASLRRSPRAKAGIKAAASLVSSAFVSPAPTEAVSGVHSPTLSMVLFPSPEFGRDTPSSDDTAVVDTEDDSPCFAPQWRRYPYGTPDSSSSSLTVSSTADSPQRSVATAVDARVAKGRSPQEWKGFALQDASPLAAGKGLFPSPWRLLTPDTLASYPKATLQSQPKQRDFALVNISLAAVPAVQ